MYELLMGWREKLLSSVNYFLKHLLVAMLFFIGLTQKLQAKLEIKLPGANHEL